MQSTAGNAPLASLGRARLSCRCSPSGLAYSIPGSNTISPANEVVASRTRQRTADSRYFMFSLAKGVDLREYKCLCTTVPSCEVVLALVGHLRAAADLARIGTGSRRRRNP